jgi:hypothetical protein
LPTTDGVRDVAKQIGCERRVLDVVDGHLCLAALGARLKVRKNGQNWLLPLVGTAFSGKSSLVKAAIP